VSIRDPLLIAALTGVAVGAYILGVLSYYIFTRCLSKGPNRHSPTQQVHIEQPGKASSYGIEGSFTPIRARSPSHFSFTKQYNLNAERHTSTRSHSSEVPEDKPALHRYTEPRPDPQTNGRNTSKLLSPPYCSPHTNSAPNVAPQTLESVPTAPQPLVSPTLVSPVILRRPTTGDPVKASPSEQTLPINHARSCSVPVALSPLVRPPPSTVAWHLPSRSRSMPKLRDSFKHERSDSEHSVYGTPTPTATATATAESEEVDRVIILDAKIFEASRALKPRSSVYLDPLSVRDSIRSTLSPTPESIMQLYGSFPAPPAPNPKEVTSETRPRTTSNASMIRASAPTTARPTTAPEVLIRPVRPLTLRPRRGGSVSVPPPQHHGLPSRPHTAGALSVPTSKSSSAFNQVTPTSPKRIHKSTSASGSLASLAEDPFLVPQRSAPTPRLATSSSLSNIRPKTPPRLTSSRNAIFFDSGPTKPQPENAVVNRRQI